MKKIFKDYLKKVQVMQQKLMGKRSMMLDVYFWPSDDDREEDTTAISVSIQLSDGEYSQNICFYDRDAESTLKSKYGMLEILLREQGFDI